MIDSAFRDRRRVSRPHRRFRIQDGNARIAPPLSQQSAQTRRVGVQRRNILFVEILPTIITCEVVDAHREMPVDGCANPFDANLAIRHPRRMVGKFRKRLLLTGNIRERRQKTRDWNAPRVHQLRRLAGQLVDARPIHAFSAFVHTTIIIDMSLQPLFLQKMARRFHAVGMTPFLYRSKIVGRHGIADELPEIATPFHHLRPTLRHNRNHRQFNWIAVFCGELRRIVAMPWNDWIDRRADVPCDQRRLIREKRQHAFSKFIL